MNALKISIRLMLLGGFMSVPAMVLVTPTREVIAASTATVEANMAAITKTWGVYIAVHLTGDEARLAQAVAADRQGFVQQGLKPAVLALRAND